MMIVARKPAMRLVGVALGFGCLVSMTGCDYWPPALQAQIEQLRSETQTLATEKAQLQVQVNDLSNDRRDLQAQFDELSRVNREKTEIITGLILSINFNTKLVNQLFDIAIFVNLRY